MRAAAAFTALVALALAACSGEGDASTPAATASATAEAEPAVATFVQGMSPPDYYQASCASCHGAEREGGAGPPLTAERLTLDASFYFETIKHGRPGTAMPAWGDIGLTDPEIRAVVAYLRGEEAGIVSATIGEGTTSALGVEAARSLEFSAVTRTASHPFEWQVTNRSDRAVELVKFTSSTLSVFLLDALPIRLEPGERRELRLVFVPNPRVSTGEATAGAAQLLVRSGDGAEEALRLAVRSWVTEPARALRLTEVALPDFPSRVATWGDHVYVGYLGGLIEVYRWTGNGALELVEQVTAIAETPNHGPDGQPNPDAAGRLIGGLALDDDGTLYVTHGDPRLNEGDFLRTGHLADLNSGAVTALDGPPGEYGVAGHRRDLVTGLPRNVTNHMPLGVAVRDGWLYVAVGAMTDSGLPDASKPEPDTELSGAVLRVNLEARDRFPLVLAPPGGPPGTTDVLEPGVLEVYATGVRNAFGLASGPDGELYLTDQSSDGGATPQPAGDAGPPGLEQNLGPDHLHRVRAGDYLGQPNLARGEPVLNDGSEYERPVARPPGYSPPLHVFGAHNSATGLAWYSGAAFPDLEGWLLVAKFSGGVGLQALRLEEGRVAEVRVLATRPLLSNVTDVAVGPGGEIVIAEFWEKRLRIASSYAPPPPSSETAHFYFGVNLDGDEESPEAYAARTGIQPEVLVDFFHFPLREQDRERLVTFLERSTVRQSVALVTLEPHAGLEAVTPAAIAEFAAVVEEADAGGAAVLVRFGHEMNGSWYAWSQQPAAYVEAFRRLADAVHEAAPRASMLWAPNYGGGYPFRGGPFETTAGEPGFATLDTDRSGALDMSDDPYGPYYPGDDAVDWVGMSLYHWGNDYPWGENEAPEPGKFVSQLGGEYIGANGDDSAVPDFYAEYAEARGKPLAIPETAALFDPAQAGDEVAVKSGWWGQIFSEETRTQFPLLRMVNWFEHRKPESEVGGAVIDWRATGDPALAEAFADHLAGWLEARDRP